MNKQDLYILNKLKQIVNEWEESKHPRDEKGRFITSSDNNQTIDEIMGEEIKGVKGQDAINTILNKQGGYVKGAFTRQDVGDIDLIWGDDSFGLKHIIKQREIQGINIKDFFADLGEVIEKGTISKNNKGRFELLHNGKIAVISPELRGNKITFLLTAYKTRKK